MGRVAGAALEQQGPEAVTTVPANEAEPTDGVPLCQLDENDADQA